MNDVDTVILTLNNAARLTLVDRLRIQELLTNQQQRIAELEADNKFLLSFAPDKPQEGLDPTFYFTLTYSGDFELWQRVERIRDQPKGESDE